MTETERLLLDSLKRLEAQYTERERQLEARLNGLTSHLEATTARLNDMTNNYQNLSQQIRILSKLLDGTSSDSANAK